jgi:hypothetical protein
MKLSAEAVLANRGLLNEEQAQRFVDLILDSAGIWGIDDSCLYWWQKPFRRWWIEDPSGIKIRKFRS